MKVIGVTGTNGKTGRSDACCCLPADGQKSAVIGTLEGYDNSRSASAAAKLRELHEDGVSVVAMEVSSHSLVQLRVQGTAFSCVFTNL